MCGRDEIRGVNVRSIRRTNLEINLFNNILDEVALEDVYMLGV